MRNALEIDSIFADRYRVVRCIAQGGMAAIFEVVHLETERRCALKVLHPQLVDNVATVRRFQREARIAACVQSEFIVDVFDAGIAAATQTPFLVMELLCGEDLGRRIKRLGPLTHDEALSHLHQTALAIDNTHNAGVVHRDLKPENLFLAHAVDGPPRIKVLDFGVAKVLAEAQAGSSTTLSAGTPRYMAPEQFDPYAVITGAADIYALGMMAYTCLVGAPYWLDEPRRGNIFTFAAIAKLGPPEPASVRAQRLGVRLPAGFDAWFAKATHVDPMQRHASATAAVCALALVLRCPAMTNAPPARRSPTPASRDRRRGPAVLLAVTAALGLVSLGALSIRSSAASAASVATAAAPKPTHVPDAQDRGHRARLGAFASAERVAERVAEALATVATTAAMDVPIIAAETATDEPPPAPPPIKAVTKRASESPAKPSSTMAPPPAPMPKRYTQE